MNKLLAKINPNFFAVSFIGPFVLSLLGILLIMVFVVLPYVNLNIESVMASPIVPGYFKDASGFKAFSFSEFSGHKKPEYKPVTHSVAGVNSTPKIFTVSVPKLGIKNAKIETDSTDLSPDHVLGHYKGTAYPGEEGNALIYGHSVLPVFYSPQNYKTIFSTLPSMVEGDKFSVSFAGSNFEYKVVKKMNMKPEEVEVFDPNPAKLGKKTSTVTLLTCVPPGSKTYRLLVVGEMVKK